MYAFDYYSPFPRVVRIEPSGACDLSCSHCPTGTVCMPCGIMRPMTFSHILKAIRTHVTSVKVVVLYHGGEPLLNTHFSKMVRQLNGIGIPIVKTVSNGMRLSEKIINAIVESGLDEIEFSLDGQNPKENNFIRRGCDYENVVTNIKNLIEKKKKSVSKSPKVYISTTQFLSHSDKHKTIQPSLPPEYLLKDFQAYEKELEFKCTWAMEWHHMEVLQDIYETFQVEDTEFKGGCDHVLNTITIRWNGDVVPCCYDLTSKYVLGNILKTDLDAIWNDEKARQLRESINSRNYISLCRFCNVVRSSVYLTIRPEIIEDLQRNR